MDISQLTPVQLIAFIADNNLHGFAQELTANGYKITGNRNQMVNAAIDAYNRGEDLSFLGNVMYNSGANNGTGSLQDNTAARGFFDGVTFNTVLGALAPVAGALLGGGRGNAAPPPPQDNSVILGLQKTTFYSILAIVVVMVAIVIYLAVKKK